MHMKNLSTFAAVLWLSGCALTDKRVTEYAPGVYPQSDGSVALVLTPEQYKECLAGGGCVTFPLSHVDPGCIFTDDAAPSKPEYGT